MEVKAAEIRLGKAYLHPMGEENLTCILPSDDISIILYNSSILSEKDIEVFHNPKDKKDNAKN